MASSWTSTVNAAAAALSPYVPADPAGIRWRLDANEAPSSLLAPLREALVAALAQVEPSRYPDARALALRAALAGWLGTEAERLVVGSGSDESIAMVLMAFSERRPGRAKPVVLIPTPTFVMYRATALLNGYEVVEVPLDDAFQLDEIAMASALAALEPNVVFLASPNNPTAAAFDPAAIARLVTRAPSTIFVLDEAYGAFSTRQPARRADDPENLVRMGTLSKIGLAALRIGWVEASPRVARIVDVVRHPFNTSATSQALACAVLEKHGAFLRDLAASLVVERERLASAIAASGAARVHPSDANFLWIEVEASADTVWRRLVDEGVLVRCFAGKGGRLDRCLRVTVGDRDANDAFLAAWAKVTRS